MYLVILFLCLFIFRLLILIEILYTQKIKEDKIKMTTGIKTDHKEKLLVIFKILLFCRFFIFIIIRHRRKTIEYRVLREKKRNSDLIFNGLSVQPCCT